MKPSRSRRALLASSTGLTTTLLAGCLTAGGSSSTQRITSTQPGTQQVDDDSPISAVYLDESDLVVELRSEPAVSELNLIGPDGSAFAHETVTRGANTVRIPLLDAKSFRFGEQHYTPGEHTLVSVSGEQTYRTRVNLEPSLLLVDVQVTLGEEGFSTGNLDVIIENVGSGPTWIHDIAYDGPHARSGDGVLNDDPYTPWLSTPKEPEAQVLPPGVTRTFRSVQGPLLQSSRKEVTCESEPIQFEMRVGVALVRNLFALLSVTPEGPVRQNLVYKTCGNATVELEDSQEAPWD